MATDLKGIAIVVMGVSGAGKSTIGKMLAEAINCSFLDADDYHSQSNKEKMQKGIPLSEEDRIPWLETLRDALSSSLVHDGSVVLGYKPGIDVCAVKLVLLEVQADALAVRVEKRAAEGKHFMPAKLLQSQLELLQVDDSEGIYRIDAAQSPQAILKIIQTEIFQWKNEEMNASYNCRLIFPSRMTLKWCNNKFVCYILLFCLVMLFQYIISGSIILWWLDTKREY